MPRSPRRTTGSEQKTVELRKKGGTAHAEVVCVQDLLTGRARETLGWRTPAEAIAEVLSEAS
ncbi:IS30 family transposase [Olsenella profusa DSM 13989]|uniref:hypothetical protein n=1 Tax=Olsenella profusa TaxID=138595 RepID=UPI00058C135E|nr:hypothetical protein [Olsenella profusa]MDP9859416.1 IS30 family transposase [Olsenella profusa DSM 13989]